MDFNTFFQIGPMPVDAIKSSYSLPLVALSYFIAVLSSYVALDIAERIRGSGVTLKSKIWWLVGGAFGMGMGIWTMHFIGMLALVMPMPMTYDFYLTALSLLIAILASGFSFYLIKDETSSYLFLIMGGIFLGLGIASLHYVGMSGMEGVNIRYLPGLFLFSIAIAIAASEAALWLMIEGSKVKKYHSLMKMGSSLVMGFAICGMHYTGMEAAVFTHSTIGAAVTKGFLDVQTLSASIAITTIVIILLALFASHIWMDALQAKNAKLLEAEIRIRAILSAAGNGIVVVDEKGIIETSNRAMEKIFGYSSEEMKERDISAFLKLQSNENQKDKKDLIPINLEKFEKDVLQECIGLTKDGTQIPIEATLSITSVDHVKLYVLLLRDIADRKRAEKDIRELNLKLVSSARMVGMAEVASSMLHNIGNALNSISISIQILFQKHAEDQSKVFELAKISRLFVEHKQRNELDAFFKSNVGQALPEYLSALSDFWKNEINETSREFANITSKIQHIENIVISQQVYCKDSKTNEKISLEPLLDEALAISFDEIKKNNIMVDRVYGKTSTLIINKAKLLQVFINMLKNAIDSLSESPRTDRRIVLRTSQENQGFVKIELIDNGVGIDSEKLTQIFTLGYTTKKKDGGFGLGFGLPSSSLLVHEMGGTLKAFSEGVGLGAAFSLIVPVDPEQNNGSSNVHGFN